MKITPPIPREHGAWAMLYTPFLVTCLVVNRWEMRIAFLAIALTSLFFAHEPLLILAGMKRGGRTDERSGYALGWLFGYTGIAAVAAAPLIFHHGLWLLAPFGMAAVASLSVHAWMIYARSERSFAAELMSILGLTSVAAVTDYVIQGTFDRRALLLWLLNALYFISSIFYVKMLVSRFSRKGDARALVWLCGTYHGILLIIVGMFAWLQWMPAMVVLAFVPIVIRALWGMNVQGIRLNLRRVGFAEVVLTLLFLVLLITGFRS